MVDIGQKVTDAVYAFKNWIPAQDYDLGKQITVVLKDDISNMNVAVNYKVVNDGQLKDEYGRAIRDENNNPLRRKLWERVD